MSWKCYKNSKLGYSLPIEVIFQERGSMPCFLGKPGGREQCWSLGLVLTAPTLPIFSTFCSSLARSNTFCSPAPFLGQENCGLESGENKFSKRKVGLSGGRWIEGTWGTWQHPLGWAGERKRPDWDDIVPAFRSFSLLMEKSSYFYPLQQLSGRSISFSMMLPCKWGASPP